ncbi:hypothetical protein BDZ91DRAFT_821324 [Kalaharituber pfeilii]|nr:hypothetical protein BDZ91DRAFT_821324 [Kalaharituber pfeilii]
MIGESASNSKIEEAHGIYWSMVLTCLTDTGEPTRIRRSTIPDSTRVNFQQLQQVAIGALLGHWGNTISAEDFSKLVISLWEFFHFSGNRTESAKGNGFAKKVLSDDSEHASPPSVQSSNHILRTLQGLIYGARDYLSKAEEKHAISKRLIAYGRQHCRKWLSLVGEQTIEKLPPMFKLDNPQLLLPLVYSQDDIIRLSRNILEHYGISSDSTDFVVIRHRPASDSDPAPCVPSRKPQRELNFRPFVFFAKAFLQRTMERRNQVSILHSKPNSSSDHLNTLLLEIIYASKAAETSPFNVCQDEFEIMGNGTCDAPIKWETPGKNRLCFLDNSRFLWSPPLEDFKEFVFLMGNLDSLAVYCTVEKFEKLKQRRKANESPFKRIGVRFLQELLRLPSLVNAYSMSVNRNALEKYIGPYFATSHRWAKALRALGTASELYRRRFPDVTIPLNVTKTSLSDWAFYMGEQDFSTVTTELSVAAAMSCILQMESAGVIEEKPMNLINVFTISCDHAMFVAGQVLKDPTEVDDATYIEYIPGNIGKTGFTLLVSRRKAKMRDI